MAVWVNKLKKVSEPIDEPIEPIHMHHHHEQSLMLDLPLLPRIVVIH